MNSPGSGEGAATPSLDEKPTDVPKRYDIPARYCRAKKEYRTVTFEDWLYPELLCCAESGRE
jgi:hypothetical protein